MSGFWVRSRVASALVTLAVAMGVQAISASQVAHAVPSADLAAIAYSVNDGTHSQIYTAAPDGTDPQAVAGQPDANNTDPATSPDGTKIAFTSDESGNFDVWVIDLETSTATDLTNSPSADSAPAWSPDGNTIAYQSDQSGNMDIWLMNPNGSGQSKLTSNPANDSQPAWFPTGRKIAFQSSRTGGTDIYTVNADGTGIKRVTTSSAPDTQPSVAPGGGTIAFTSKRNNNTDIYTVPAGGGTNTRVTTNAATDNQPAYSTDGRWLAYTSNRSGITQIYAAPRPSGTTVAITSGPNPALSADYMPYTYPTPLWTQRLTGSQTGGAANVPFAAAESPDGSKVFVSGGVFASNGNDIAGFVAAYDNATGAQVWLKTFAVTGFGGSYAVAVAPDSSSVYVSGYGFNSILVEKYRASDGFPQANYSTACGKFATVYTMAVSPDGTHVGVSGTCYGSTGLPTQADTILLTSSLTEVWQEKLTGGDPAGATMRFNSGGDTLFWTGIHHGSPASDIGKDNFQTVAYATSDGSVTWQRTYNGPGNGPDEAWGLGLSPDGSTVYVTGNSFGNNTTKSDVATIAYSATSGTPVWTVRYNSPNNGWDGGNALTLSPDGSTIYVGGNRSRTVSGKLTFDYLTLSLAASNGAVNWARTYNGPGDYTKIDDADQVTSIFSSPDGSRVFVSGGSFRTGTAFDETSVAYDSSGNQVWLGRYDGPQHKDDYSFAGALSPDGTKLFATGPSLGTSASAGGTVGWDVGSVLAGPAARIWGAARPSAAAPDVARGGLSADGMPAGLRLKLHLEAIIRSR